MLYEDYRNSLIFPSGRSVGNCKKDAQKLRKEQKKAGQEQIHKNILDELAQKHMGVKSIAWDDGIEKLKEESVAAIPDSPAKITLDDLTKLAKRHKALTQYGVGVPASVETLHEFSPPQSEAEVAPESGQNELLFSEETIPRINLAITFIRCLSPSLRLNKGKNRTSLELKHLAESYLSIQHPDTDTYISHGVFILAALHQGYLPQLSKKEGTSLYFNFDESSIRDVESLCGERTGDGSGYFSG